MLTTLTLLGERDVSCTAGNFYIIYIYVYIAKYPISFMCSFSYFVIMDIA